ncbi:MAG TPA: NUDIX domain-containing protein [Trueperaceae bacterium]|nr:NUDIX domain-containing protein [Trueperaceae bacterium]
MRADAGELLQLLDEAGVPLAAGKPRARVHADGDWHRAFHLWVVREGQLVLFQRRARGKDLEPGKIDVTVGGHVRVGETLVDVVREAEEEIGLEVRPGELTFLGSARSVRRYDGALDREVADVYVVRDERPLDAYALACDEVEVLYEVSLERAIALYRDGGYVAAAGFDCQRRANNALLVEHDLIAQGRALTAGALQRVRDWLAGADPAAWADAPIV